jgi:excinuclease UvrABC nuclease subunit
LHDRQVQKVCLQNRTTMRLTAQAQSIFNQMSSLPFEECFRLSRKFVDFPANPGIYVVRHRTHGVLYIGKSTNVRRRFCDGHKALCWAFIDRYNPDDIRIAVYPTNIELWMRSADIEALMIKAQQPEYNDTNK